MEDVQDGKGTAIKVIEDGVAEVVVEFPLLASKSGVGMVYLVTTITNPQITSVYSQNANAEKKTASITSVFETSVA